MTEMQAILTQIKRGDATLVDKDWRSREEPERSLGFEIWQLSDGRFVGFDPTAPLTPLTDAAASLDDVEEGLELLRDTGFY